MKVQRWPSDTQESASWPEPYALHGQLRASQELLSARASDVSLAALTAALLAMGYREEEVEFRSNLTSLHQPGLISAIAFQEEPRRAVVTLNIGLLATQSPLPNYIFQYMSMQSSSTLEEFLGFCAHHSLRHLAASQTAVLVTDEHRRRAQRVLLVLGIKSASTVHWIFSKIFPELSIQVQRGDEQVMLPCPSVQLGRTVLGDGSSFGASSPVALPRISVTLTADDGHCRTGEHWQQEAALRLIWWVFPLLQSQRLFLTVMLVIHEADGWLTLGSPRHLGIEPFRSLSPLTAITLRRILLFRGEVNEAASRELQRTVTQRESNYES